ncbi:HutP family protein [uncultured Veillonella sp.]|uniref:HutP family protein n=1 Tax=uncultured Veillonella sp. TaxID=159268 RepID=UPI0025F84504|nr:HutP family protein [uncultured Veillonella sp.]
MAEQEKDNLFESSMKTPGTAAMFLALTQTLHDENKAKGIVAKFGLKAVVTEVGGKATLEDFSEKVNKAVIGACLNSGIITKTINEIHAVVHATEEAKKGVMINVSTSASLALKLAVVRDDHWIAVALFGKSALHYVTNHERAGLGIMHI